MAPSPTNSAPIPVIVNILYFFSKRLLMTEPIKTARPASAKIGPNHLTGKLYIPIINEDEAVIKDI